MAARRLTCLWLLGNKQQVVNDVPRAYASADRDYSEIHKLAAEHAQRDARREVKNFSVVAPPPPPNPRPPNPAVVMQFLAVAAPSRRISESLLIISQNSVLSSRLRRCKRCLNPKP